MPQRNHQINSNQGFSFELLVFCIMLTLGRQTNICNACESCKVFSSWNQSWIARKNTFSTCHTAVARQGSSYQWVTIAEKSFEASWWLFHVRWHLRPEAFLPEMGSNFGGKASAEGTAYFQQRWDAQDTCLIHCRVSRGKGCRLAVHLRTSAFKGLPTHLERDPFTKKNNEQLGA